MCSVVAGMIASTEETYRYKMQLAKGGSSSPSPGQGRARTTSGTSSTSSQGSRANPSTPRSADSSHGHSPRGADPPHSPGSPSTKTAGDVKAGLVSSINEGDLVADHDNSPTPNGNLRYSHCFNLTGCLASQLKNVY